MKKSIKHINKLWFCICIVFQIRSKSNCSLQENHTRIINQICNRCLTWSTHWFFGMFLRRKRADTNMWFSWKIEQRLYSFLEARLGTRLWPIQFWVSSNSGSRKWLARQWVLSQPLCKVMSVEVLLGCFEFYATVNFQKFW